MLKNETITNTLSANTDTFCVMEWYGGLRDDTRSKCLSAILNYIKGSVCNTNDRIYEEGKKIGYRFIKTSSPYKARISVGCGDRRCVRERALGNGMPNQSNISSEEVEFGSGIERFGSKNAWWGVKGI